jgi:hypothetical protein
MNVLRHGLPATHIVNNLEPQDNVDVTKASALPMKSNSAPSKTRPPARGACAVSAPSRRFNDLNLYEGRLHRGYFRALTAFLTLADRTRK